MTLQDFMDVHGVEMANVGAVRAVSGDEPDYIADVIRDKWASIVVDEVIVNHGSFLRIYSKEVEEEFRSYWPGRIEVEIQRLFVFK